MKKKLPIFFSVLIILTFAVAMLVGDAATSESSKILDVSTGDGMAFDGLSLYTTKDKEGNEICVTEIPVTYEAWIKIPAGYNQEQGDIYGNYDGLDANGVRFKVFSYGRPYLYLSTVDGASSHFYFSDTYISNSEWTHIAIVDDTASGYVTCYINGEIAGTTKMSDAIRNADRSVSQRPMCLGGSYLPGTTPFGGNIRSVAVYNDVRTAEEIKADMNSINLDDSNLISAYNLNGKKGADVIEDATGKYNMINNRATNDWVTPEQVPAVDDFDYSIALVGDTQILSGYYPELYHTYFDWLLENKDEHKIEHVLNLGDLTNFNYDWEWDNVRNEWFRLNSELDYTLVRGDHDILDDKTNSTDYDTNKYDLWFNVDEYKIGKFVDENGNPVSDAGYYTGNDGSFTNTYRAITIGEVDYLIVTVDKYPSDDVMRWIDGVVTNPKYVNHRVIMTMHCYLDNDGNILDEGTRMIGDDFWESVKDYPNLHMIICGHVYAWGVTWTKAEGTHGNVVNQVVVNPQGPEFDQAGPTGMIAMLYFSNNGNDVDVRYYSPILDKYYVGNHNEVQGTYNLVSSAFSIKTNDFSVANQITEYLPKNENVDSTPDESVTEIPTVTYGVGDDFETKFEEALKLAEKSDVNFVMSTNFTATKNITLGSEVLIPKYKVKVTSADTSSVVELATGGFNFVLWGDIEFDNIKISGNSKSSSNTLFCPENCSIKIGNNVTVGAAKANVAGQNLEINSGEWYIVAAMVDYTVLDGYIDKTSKDSTPKYRTIFMEDPQITLQGTAKAYDVFGGSNTHGYSYYNEYCTISVIGTSTVNILGSASVERFATASGNSGRCTHNGVINVNTTGTIARLCAAVGPVGINERSATPSYTLNITAVGGTNGGTFNGVWMNNAGYHNQANTTINVYGGTFSTSNSYGGMVVNADNIPNAINYGKNVLNIYGGTFNGEVFGGGLFYSESGIDYADIEMNIYGGKFLKDVYGSSRFLKKNCSNSGEVVFTITGGVFTSVRGGSYFATDADNSIHGKNTTTIIDGGEFTADIYGGSYMWGGSAYKEHKGNSLLELKSGTFGTNTSVYGSSYMGNKYLKVTGNIGLNIYGGVALSANVYGGATSQGSSGTGFALSKGDGNLISGDITFNIFDVDKNGNKATATISKTLYAGSYINTWWAEMSGDITYNFKGVKLAHATSGGCLLNKGRARMSGDINGTLDSVTFGGTFYGGSRITADYANHSGDSTLTLINTNVVSNLSAGPSIEKSGSTDFSGLSTLIYKSGYVSANGFAIGGCYFTVPNVKITGSSKVVFGETSGTPSSTPYVKEGGKLIGGSFAANNVFTTAGVTTEWGMYGSSDVVMNNGEIQIGGYIIGGSYIATTNTPSTSVDWTKYPVVGGIADSSTNKNHTKLTINGGTVNGPRIYAGSYLEDGGQDHGTVELEVNGGNIVMTSGIKNYSDSRDTGSFFPATYYSSKDAKALNCNYVLTLNGGKYNFPRQGTTAGSSVGISAGMAVYGGGVTGNTTLNLNVSTIENLNFNYRPGHIVGGMYNIHKKLSGDTTLNVFSSGTVYCNGIVTAGCTGWWDATEVSGDGIYKGFWHEGDVYVNYAGGNLTRMLYATGYKSNVKGNAYINVSSGVFSDSLYGSAGYATTGGYSSVTGDVIWNISGGTFNKAVYGGGNATSSYCPAKEYNVIGGNIYVEITGGTFNDKFYLGGKNGVLANKEARVKLIGEDFAIGANGAFAAYEAVSGVTVAGTYTLDMLQSGVAVSGTGFGKTINQLNGAEVSFKNSSDETIEFNNGDVFAETIAAANVSIGNKTYAYADIVKFDGYTEYDNAFVIVNAETNEVVTEMAEELYDIKVNVGEVYSAPITLKVKPVEPEEPEVVPVTFQRSMQAMLDLEDSVKMGVGYKLEGMENFDVTDEEFLSRFGLLVWKSEISEEDALITHPDAVATYGATYNADAGRFETRTNGIPAKMLGDKLWFRAFFVNEDGSYSYSRVIANYSPTTYCFNQIRDNYTNKNLVNLMASILQYGTEAQLMFNHNTDNLMIDILDGFATNATLTLTAEEIAELKSVDWDPSIVRTDFNVPDGKDSAYTKANEITTRGGNLDLEDKIGTRFYSNVNFKATSAKIYYWFESDIAGLDSLNYLENARGSADMVWSEANSRYEYLFEGRAAKEMFETIFVIMVYEDGNGNTITSGVVGYSPERFGYINGVQKTTPSTNLARATVVYGKAAKTYFG